MKGENLRIFFLIESFPDNAATEWQELPLVRYWIQKHGKVMIAFGFVI
jgi:hypothetical protein